MLYTNHAWPGLENPSFLEKMYRFLKKVFMLLDFLKVFQQGLVYKAYQTRIQYVIVLTVTSFSINYSKTQQ